MTRLPPRLLAPLLLPGAALLLGQQGCPNAPDKDGDGWTVEAGDCDDNNNTVYPGAEERCDGLDNNCDAIVDEGVQTASYPDADGDTFGGDAGVVFGCAVPEGYLLVGGDCDDADPAVFPGQADLPQDGLDANCDGRDGALAVVDGGAAFTVALDDEGRVWTWGDNSAGQLARPVGALSGVPGQVEGIPVATDVSAGAAFGVALGTDGTVWRWGDSLPPAPVAGLPPITDVEAGDEFILMLDGQGSVWALGRNASGQLGTGNRTDALTTPVLALSIVGATRLAAGAAHSLAVDTAGALWVWGESGSGQTGVGNTTDVLTPRTLTVGTGQAVEHLAAGAAHSLVTLADGSLWGFGRNTSGELADGTLTSRLAPVASAPSIWPVTRVAAGLRHSLAAGAGGLYAWGDNAHGQLGDGGTTDASGPLRIDDGAADLVAAGRDHSFASEAGVTRGWGKNDRGQLGRGVAGDPLPVDVFGPEWGPVAALAGGRDHTSALLTDGRIVGWGDGGGGQLGNGASVDSETPVAALGISGALDVVAGESFVLALLADGRVMSWGRNENGQLGDGTTSLVRNTPAPVSGLAGAVAIGAGENHGLAIDGVGAAWAWGSNSFGQLGNGNSTSARTPVAVSGVSGVVDVSGGLVHSVASDDSGQVWAWGQGSRGQLGQGAAVPQSLVPVLVPGLAGIVDVEGGTYFSLALDGEGRVFLWGTVDLASADLAVFAPVELDLPVVVDMAAGEDHALFVTDGGEVWFLGANDRGQGCGVAASETSVPAPCALAPAGVLVDAGENHSLLLGSDGLPFSWGDDGSGQLGTAPHWRAPGEVEFP